MVLKIFSMVFLIGYMKVKIIKKKKKKKKKKINKKKNRLYINNIKLNIKNDYKFILIY